jgi:hypothetical protein
VSLVVSCNEQQSSVSTSVTKYSQARPISDGRHQRKQADPADQTDDRQILFIDSMWLPLALSNSFKSLLLLLSTSVYSGTKSV